MALTMYSLRDKEYPVSQATVPQYSTQTLIQLNEQLPKKELHQILNSFRYQGGGLPSEIQLSSDNTVRDYFRQFPGLDAGDHYNNAGFWKLPIPVCAAVDMSHDDVVIYDADGYDVLRDFLKKNAVRKRDSGRIRHRHVLLQDDSWIRKPVSGFQRLSGRRCDPRYLPREPDSSVRHQCPHFFCVTESTDHPVLLDPND